MDDVIKIPRSDAMLACLDRVVAVAEETDENGAFEGPVIAFWNEFYAQCQARDLCQRWSPVVVLELLAQSLARDESLPEDTRVDYAAAVSTVRDLVIAARHAKVALN